MKLNVALLLILVFTILACQTKLKIGDRTGTWTSVESKDGSLPEKRHEAAFVGMGDQFFLLGGRRMKPTSIFDYQNQIWSDGAKVPVEMHHFQPVTFDEKIYILGALSGKYPAETPLPNIYIYNPATDSWAKGDPIPEDRRRGGAGAVVYKDKIYLACGIKDGHRGDHKRWLDVYDPQTGEWKALADAPRPRDHFQAVVAKDKLYLLGGRTTRSSEGPFKNTIPEVDVYDFKTNSWSTLQENLPTPRAGNYAILYGEDILVMGGESATQKSAHHEVEALNTKTHTWRSLSPLLQGRHGTGVVLYENKLYVASGSGNRGGGPELTSMECLSF